MASEPKLELERARSHLAISCARVTKALSLVEPLEDPQSYGAMQSALNHMDEAWNLLVDVGSPA